MMGRSVPTNVTRSSKGIMASRRLPGEVDDGEVKDN